MALTDERYTNNALTTLAAGIAADALSLTVLSGDGALFPNPTGNEYFWVTLEQDGVIEVLKCEARSTDTLSSLTRAQQGTSAAAFTTGANVYLALTAETLNLIRAALDTAAADITALEGDVLAAESAITTLQGDVAAAEAAITTLQGDVLAAEGAITTLQGDVAAAEDDILALQGDVVAIEGDLTTLEGDVAAITPTGTPDGTKFLRDDFTWQEASGGNETFNVLAKTTVAYQAGYDVSGNFRVVPIGFTHVPTVLSAVGVANKDDNAWLEMTSASAGGSQCGWSTTVFTYFQSRWDPTYEILLRSLSALTSVRLWIGFASVIGPNSDTAPAHFAGFRFSSVAGDTGWTPVTRGGGDQTVGTTIGTVDADTIYRLKIRFSDAGTNVHFSVNGGAEQTISTNLPTTTQAMGLTQNQVNQAASARSWWFGRSILTMGGLP